MLKAVAAIHLRTPDNPPERSPPTLDSRFGFDDANACALARVPQGFTVLRPGEVFDPAAWGMDAAETDRLVRTGVADPVSPPPAVAEVAEPAEDAPRGRGKAAA